MTIPAKLAVERLPNRNLLIENVMNEVMSDELKKLFWTIGVWASFLRRGSM